VRRNNQGNSVAAVGDTLLDDPLYLSDCRIERIQPVILDRGEKDLGFVQGKIPGGSICELL